MFLFLLREKSSPFFSLLNLLLQRVMLTRALQAPSITRIVILHFYTAVFIQGSRPTEVLRMHNSFILNIATLNVKFYMPQDKIGLFVDLKVFQKIFLEIELKFPALK